MSVPGGTRGTAGDERTTRVLASVDAQRAHIIEFLQRLVRLRSVNPVFSDTPPVEEAAIQRYLADTLRTLGFVDIDLWEPDPDHLARYRGKPGFTEGRTFANRPNLVARLPGAGGGRSIFLTGHVDVVGADANREAWRHDPFSAVIEDGHVYGRGSVDMKGGIAAMIMAVAAVRAAGFTLAGDVLVGTVVDEETGSMGMLSLADRGYRADAGVMTEPTNLQVSLLCRGIVWGRITVQGKSGHIEIAQPHWSEGGAVDAFREALKIVRALDDLNDEWQTRPDRRHPLLPRPCQVNVSMVSAGQHPSSWAEQCVLTVDAQYLPAERDEHGLGGRIKNEIEAAIRAVARTDAWLAAHPPTISWFVDADCAEVDVHHPLVDALARALTGLGLPPQPSGTEAHTDMSLLTNMAQTPTVNFGPGDIFVAHQTNEAVAIEDVITATKVIALALLDWCGVAA